MKSLVNQMEMVNLEKIEVEMLMTTKALKLRLRVPETATSGTFKAQWMKSAIQMNGAIYTMDLHIQKVRIMEKMKQ